MTGKLKCFADHDALKDNGPAPAARSLLIACEGRSIHVRLWPGDAARTVVIWHGITGTSLDHVELAERLASRGFQVVAPDSLGCGLSDRADDATLGYGLAPLARVAAGLLDALAIERLCWIGLSKGGGLGIRLAAERPERIAGLILCDVGPGLPPLFRAGLAKRLADPPVFETMAAFRAHVARLLIRNGVDARDALVDRLALAWSRRRDDGGIGYHYDPGLAQQFLHCPEDFDLWDHWDRIACPILILRGAHSDVLSDDEMQAMLGRNAGAQGAILEGSGHLNFLDARQHQNRVISFVTGVAWS